MNYHHWKNSEHKNNIMLKIKDDVVLYPYGKACNGFDSKSELSQEILEHLQSRFPDDIEEIKEAKQSIKK